MAAMGTFLENALIDHIFRNTTYTTPTRMFIALVTTNAAATDTGTGLTAGVNYVDPYTSAAPVGVEVTQAGGTSYTRQAYAQSSSSDWTATQGGVSGASTGTTGLTSNNTTITFTTAGASWGTITGVALCDNQIVTSTTGTFTNGNTTVTGITTTNVFVGDPIFLHTAQPFNLSCYVGTIPGSGTITLSSTQATNTATTWGGTTSTTGTFTDAGNMLFFGTLTSSKTVGTGDVFQFNANQLSVALS